jgi:DnaJ-class molecular chaperone
LTTIGVHCADCLGTGIEKTRTQIGTFTFKACPTCNGLGKKLAQQGSGEHRIAANIGAMKGYFDGKKRR